MDSTVLAETQAFIAREREALINQREELLNQQRAVQDQIDQLDEMLAKFDVFEGSRLAGVSKLMPIAVVAVREGAEAGGISC